MIRLCVILLRVALVLSMSLIFEGAKLWLFIRPLKRIRQWRTRRKMQSWHEEHGGPPDEILESFHDEGVQVDKLAAFFAKLAQYRTSTKSGATGLIVPPVAAAVALLPFYDSIAAFISQACAQPDPTDFIVVGAVAWGVTWASMFVSARASKTPANPGKL